MVYFHYRYSALATILSFICAFAFVLGIKLLRMGIITAWILILISGICLFWSIHIGKLLNRRALFNKIKADTTFCEMLVEKNSKYRYICMDLNDEYKVKCHAEFLQEESDPEYIKQLAIIEREKEEYHY